MINIVHSPSLAYFKLSKAKTGFNSNDIYYIADEGRLWTKGAFLGPKVVLSGTTAQQADGHVTISKAAWNGDVIGVTYGGTGLSSVTKGAILYASDANTWAALAAGSANNLLTMNASGLPEWKDTSNISIGTATKVGNKLTIKINSGNSSSNSANTYEFDGSAAKTFTLIPGSNISITKGTGDNVDVYTISASIGVSSIKVATTGLTDLSSAKTGAIVLGDAASKVVTTTVASGGTGLPTAGAVYTFVTTQNADALKVANITTPASANDYVKSVAKDSTNKTLTFTSGSFAGLTVSYGALTSTTGFTYKPNDASGSTIYIPTALNHLTGMGTMVDGNIVVGDGTTGIKNSGYGIQTSGTLSDSGTQIAVNSIVKSYVDNKITSAMYFRGTVNISTTNNISSLTFPEGTTSYNPGDAWRVGTVAAGSAVKINGKPLESGDLIIATVKRTSASAFALTDFTVVQNNADVFGGATANAAGSVGFVPLPAAGQQGYILLGGGSWTAPSSITVGYATYIGSSTAKYSYTDIKSKFDALETHLEWCTIESDGKIVDGAGNYILS